jgi:hypothetical protein
MEESRIHGQKRRVNTVEMLMEPTPAPVRRIEICAILGTVFGALGMFAPFGWVFGLVAIILSIASFVRIQNHGELTGKGWAVAGLVLGTLNLLILFISIRSATGV